MKKIILLLIAATTLLTSASFINGAGYTEYSYDYEYHSSGNYADWNYRATGCNLQVFEWEEGDDTKRIYFIPGSPEASRWIERKIKEYGIYRFERKYEESERYDSNPMFWL
jgi:hypothetical protein